MSRCFPFPPPGYEKKPSTDEPDLLKKEKRKEKKHKKDKKEKDKKDGKEKREKDRSEGKLKDKKDKKDKHRDKKKEKEKGKSSATDEKKVHEEKLPHNDEQNKEKNSFPSDKKPFLQFQSGEYNEQLQKKEEPRKENNSSSDDKKSSILFRGENGEFVHNRIKAMENENSKFVQELDRRIRNEEKGTGSHQFFTEGRKNSFDKVEVQKTDGWQAIMDETRFGRNAAFQDKINGTTHPPLDNGIDRSIEQKERIQEKQSDDKRGDKRKNKDRDKQRQGKDKDSEKEKKEDKSKGKSELKKAEWNKNNHIMKNESMTTIDNLSTHPRENCFLGAGNEVNMKKRKDTETNGVSHENELRPNKMARHISNMSPEIGRKLDSLQNPGSRLLDKQGLSQGASQNNFKVGSKGQRVNGMISSSPGSLSAKKPPVSSFNHVPSKPSPIKSPPLITNHVTARSSPIHTTKPPPNIVAAQQPKPQPSIPSPIPAQPQILPSTHSPSTIAKQPVSQPKPPPVVKKVSPPPPPPLPIPKKVAPPAATEPSVKPPHPDTKYLYQILTVPKLEPWCGFDDQEWLFSGKAGPSIKKTTMEDLQVQVWSEAKHIESVDVCALPYVIPY